MNVSFESLIATLAGAPALVGARCRGKGHLFDLATTGEAPEVVAARHKPGRWALSALPCTGAVPDMVDGLPRSKRPEGVIAGRRPMSKRVANEATG